jgi:Uncharacterized lipoprotein
VTVAYTPEKKVERVNGAGMVVVTVTDLRANPNKVGSVTGAAPKAGNLKISTTTDVADVIRIAVESELGDRGFAVGSGIANVAIDVSQFDVQRVIIGGVWFGAQGYESHAQVLLHVEVTGPGHKRTYDRMIFGQSDSENGSDEATLDLALQRALQSLFADPKFTSAILAAERSQSGITN